MNKKTITIATRGSMLALWQANHIKDSIEKEHPGTTVELLKIKTTGDKILDVPLAKVGGKGLFTKEIEEALLDDRADLAVHSLKDVPTEFPEGLSLTAYTERQDATDALISNGHKKLTELNRKIEGVAGYVSKKQTARFDNTNTGTQNIDRDRLSQIIRDTVRKHMRPAATERYSYRDAHDDYMYE